MAMGRLTAVGILMLLGAGCSPKEESAIEIVEVPSNEENSGFRAPPPAVEDYPDFKFERRDACEAEHDPYADDAMSFGRSNDRLRLAVYASVTCSSVAAYPAISFLKDLITVSVVEYSLTTDGSVAACNCTNVLYFDFKRDVPKGTRIVFLKDGKVTAEGDAP